MSGLPRGAGRVKDLAQGDPASTLNWRLLDRPPEEAPTLLWPSVHHPTQIREFDSRKIPSLELIGIRHKENSDREERDVLMSCKVFWEVFQRSRMVILFDRYSDQKLLRRLRDELEPGRARSLDTLIVFAGTVKRKENAALAKSIEEVLIKAKSQLKFHYLDGMESSAKPHPHDRFAVTDGEFWHFGGSVGGIERCLTAVSRGWKAKDIGVEDFVKATWAEMARGQQQ
jgi:hypothetical protein